VLYVPPHPDGFCIFKADGFYGKAAVFRAGDVYARHGSASERWQQPDIDRIRKRLRERTDKLDRAYIYETVLPRTLNVVGQAQRVICELARAAGHEVDPDAIGRPELEQFCSSVSPKAQAPLVIGVEGDGAFEYGTWWAFLRYARLESEKFSEQVRRFAPFLEGQHLALLAAIDQGAYFGQLDSYGEIQPCNGNFSWIAGSMWQYLEHARNLKAYVIRVGSEMEGHRS
jgi:hypothetical protein